jgi:hypothetical protein
MLQEYDVPQRLSKARFHDFPAPLRGALSSASESLVLHGTRKVGIHIVGPARSGKSYAAAACLRYFALNGMTVAWRSADDLTESNYEIVRGNDETVAEAEHERWYLRDVVEALVIDNVDLLALTEFSARHLWSIIHGRADTDLITILTTPPLSVTNARAFKNAAVVAAQSLNLYVAGAFLRVTIEPHAAT